jgi:hypothetical protein
MHDELERIKEKARVVYIRVLNRLQRQRDGAAVTLGRVPIRVSAGLLTALSFFVMFP